MAHWNEWKSHDPTQTLRSLPNAESSRYKGSKKIGLEDRNNWVDWQASSAKYQELEQKLKHSAVTELEHSAKIELKHRW
jgi:hypothetical protein